MDWPKGEGSDTLYLSVLSLGELRRGVGALPPGPRRARTEAWLSEALSQFSDRILPIDARVATGWAEVTLCHRRLGAVVGAIDELIAATAIVHDLTVVTRNVRHFEASGCRLVAPWSAAA